MQVKLVLAAAVAAMSAFTVSAELILDGHVRYTGLIGERPTRNPTDVVPAGGFAYDNTDPASFTGFVGFNTGATGTGAAAITRLVADDIVTDGAANQAIGAFSFSMANNNATAVSVRPRVRFYADNAGAPGAYITGYSFNAISVAATSFTIVGTGFTFPAAGAFTVPADGKFWAGITFDAGGTGTATATIAQLNNFGQAYYDPAIVGSSDNTKAFRTTASGSFVSNNPPGANFTTTNTLSEPITNFAWDFQVVPEPTSMGLVGMASLTLLARRRK